MRIVVSADHAGYELKKIVVAHVGSLGHEALDVGTDSSDPVDYPDFSEKVATVIREKRADRGIILCGSGVGACIAANKVPGIRAGVCHDTYSARQGVDHDAMNVLVMGARVIGPELAKELVRVFLSASFSKEERHHRRLEKVNALETRYRAG